MEGLLEVVSLEVTTEGCIRSCTCTLCVQRNDKGRKNFCMKEFLHELRAQLDYIKCNVRIHVTHAH